MKGHQYPNMQHFQSWRRDQHFKRSMKKLRATGIFKSDRIFLLSLSPEVRARLQLDGKPLDQLLREQPSEPSETQ